MSNPIQIFTTGGTIDKIYFDANSEFEVGDSQIGELLAEARVAAEYRVEELMRKDSLELTDADRQLLADRCATSSAERILVTHGTDTMVDSAMSMLDIQGKTIVFTGAMQPARLRVSDAVFNVGFALAAVQLLPHGVYLAMHGTILDPRQTRKNVAAQRFESNA
jgi:L-asparaginase